MVESPRSQDENDANAGERGEGDPRLAFIYREALRGLLQQQTLVEGLNNRAGNVIFATSFASSLLGARALSDGIGFWDWLALTLLFVIGALIVLMLWPYYNYTFRFDPKELLSKYVDGGAYVSMSEMHRELALRIEADRLNNWRIIQRLRVALQFSLILLLLEILAWLFSIARL
jgi:hypothetical protein